MDTKTKPTAKKAPAKKVAPVGPPMLEAAKLIEGYSKTLSRDLDKAKKGGAAALARLYSVSRLHFEILGEQLKEVGKLIDLMNRVYIPEAFEAEKIQTLTDALTGDRVTIGQRLLASIPAEHREAAYDWLRKNGHESLIQETVNASSLSAFAKAQLEVGVELPDELFKTTILNQVSLTRGKKGRLSA